MPSYVNARTHMTEQDLLQVQSDAQQDYIARREVTGQAMQGAIADGRVIVKEKLDPVLIQNFLQATARY